MQPGRGRSGRVMARPSGFYVDAKKPPASCFDIAQLLLHPLVETRDIDPHALVVSPADRLLLVARLDLEAQPPALDAGEPRGGDDAHADRRGGMVADVELDAEALMARRQQGLDGVERGGLHQVDHHRGGEHPHPSAPDPRRRMGVVEDRNSTRLNSSHANISYAVFCLKKKKRTKDTLHANIAWRYCYSFTFPVLRT